MSGLAGVLAVLALGAGIHAWTRRSGSGLPWGAGVPMWGALGCAIALGLAALAGVRWSRSLVLGIGAVGLAGLALGLRREAWRAPRRWALLAAAIAAPQAVRLAANPSVGWDFRYIWGLKARVFAVAGGYDWSWLAWPGHAPAHTDYPPGWPDLLAAGALAGADVPVIAAVWQGLLALALASACWRAARGAAPALRTLAAASGAWAPVIFEARHSGYAEPLLAFAAVVALASLRDLARREPGSVLDLTGAVALLALTKNEGIALAAGVAAGAIVVARGRGATAILGLVPAALWRGVAAAHGVVGQPLELAPAAVAHRLVGLPAGLAEALTTPPIPVLAAVWLLALGCVLTREGRGVAIALAVWLLATIAMYTVGREDLHWWLATSLERVLAAPLPAVLALAIGATWAEPAEA